MKRSELEKYIGKKVKITFFDKTTVFGTLAQGNGYFFTKKDYHIIEHPIAFKCSHVRKLEEV